MTELWELPRGWRWATMGDVSKVVGGSTPKTSEPAYWGGNIPWVTPDDLSGFTGKHIERGRRTITQAGYDSCSTQMVPAGTVLFTSRAPIGYVAIASHPVCTNQGFKSFVCGPEMDAEYVYWYLRASTELARSMASGTTFLELSGKAAARIPVPVPPLAEQGPIVDAIETQLGRSGAAGETIREARRKLDRYRAAVFRSALGLNGGRPASWPLRRVDEIGSVYIGGTPKRSRPEYWGGAIPWVSSGEVRFNRIDATRELLTEAGLRSSSAELHPVGTVLLAMIGEGRTRGQAAILGIEAGTNQNVAAIRLSSSVLPDWLFYVLMAQYQRTRTLGSGNNQPALSKTRVAAIEIPVPDVAEQASLVASIEEQLTVIGGTDSEIERALLRDSGLRRAILDMAFRGALATPSGTVPA
jgi:type I restriction enzyme, S subunit